MKNKVVELGIVDRASHSTIGRTLKKTVSNPIAGNAGSSTEGQQHLVAAMEDVLAAYLTSKKCDECKRTTAERQRTLKAIAKVPLRAKDPIYGEDGPLTEFWK